MRREQLHLSLFLCLAALAACATGEGVDREPGIEDRELAEALGCEPGELPICIATSCEPEDYYCADEADVFEMLGRKHRHR